VYVDNRSCIGFKMEVFNYIVTIKVVNQCIVIVAIKGYIEVDY